MLKNLASIGFLAAAFVVSACVPATLGGAGGGSHDGGVPCPGGTLVPERCYRACDGAETAVLDGLCQDGYVYSPAHCSRITLELVANTCGADAGADASDGGAGTSGGAGTTGGAGTSGGVVTSGAAGAGGAGGAAGGGGMAGAGGVAGGGGAGRGGEAGAGNGPCTDLVNDAPPAIQRFHMEVRPAEELGVGGQFADGVYDLSVIDYYGTSRSGTPPAITGTVRISNAGTRMEAVTWYEQGNVVTAEVRTLAPAGTQVTETGTCPIRGPNTEGYSATPDRFMLSNPMTVNRYVRRAN
jgi:hypothetical protein